MTAFDYSRTKATAQRMLDRFAQGTVQVRRETSTPGANPWETPTATSIDTYTMSAAVEGVAAKYIDGTVVLASDLQVMMAVSGTHVLTGADGTTAADGSETAIEPQMSDEILIEGVVKEPKRIVHEPGAGTRAMSIVFVAS